MSKQDEVWNHSIIKTRADLKIWLDYERHKYAAELSPGGDILFSWERFHLEISEKTSQNWVLFEQRKKNQISEFEIFIGKAIDQTWSEYSPEQLWERTIHRPYRFGYYKWWYRRGLRCLSQYVSGVGYNRSYSCDWQSCYRIRRGDDCGQDTYSIECPDKREFFRESIDWWGECDCVGRSGEASKQETENGVTERWRLRRIGWIKQLKYWRYPQRIIAVH